MQLMSIKTWEAYLENKYRFAVKTNGVRFRKKILLLSDSAFFNLFGAGIIFFNFKHTLYIKCE